LSISGIINVLLNLFFVLLCDLSVAGVAIATTLSNICSATVLLLKLRKEDGFCHFSFRKMRILGKELAELLQIGMPAGLQSIAMSFGTMFIQSSVVGVNNTVCPGGSYVLDGNAAGTNLSQLVGSFTNAVALSTMPFAGQHYGAGKLHRIRKVMFYSWFVALCANAMVCLVLLPFGKFLCGIYVSDPRALEVGLLKLYILTPLYFSLVIASINSNVLRAIGYSTTATVLYLLGICGIRVGWALFVFPALFARFGKMEHLYVCFPISWIITALVTTVVCFALLNKKIRKKVFVGG
jgi:Na+-driven multidrug efflux pump